MISSICKRLHFRFLIPLGEKFSLIQTFEPMKLCAFVILGFAFISCSKPTERTDTQADSLAAVAADTDTTEIDYEASLKLESYLTKTIGSEAETIDYTCAILIYPTEEQIEAMKKEVGEDDFYTIADDSQFYLGMAIEKIDSVGIKTATAGGQWLRLKGQAQTWDLDIRKKNLPEWNVIFFNTTKEPKIISAIDLTTTEVRTYFDQAVGQEQNK
jgi:hypothetical protein